MNPSPGVDVCGLDPSTSVAHVDFSTNGDAWLNEPIAVTAGWTEECSPTACDFAGYGTCIAPSVDATLSVSGVATDVEAMGETSVDPESDEGMYRVFSLSPSAPGTLSVHVETTSADRDTPFASDQTFVIRKLDDIQLSCVDGDAQPIDCSTIAAGAEFNVMFAGVSAGQQYRIFPQLTWTGAIPPTCNPGLCTFYGGAPTPSTLTVELAGITRTLTIP